MKWWITINEPQEITKGYGSAEYAPLLNLHGTGEYLSGHNIIRAHAKAYRLYDTEFRENQNGKPRPLLNLFITFSCIQNFLHLGKNYVLFFIQNIHFGISVLLFLNVVF